MLYQDDDYNISVTQEFVETEQIFFDAELEKISPENEAKIEQAISKKSFLILYFIAICLMSIAVFRIGYLSIIKGAQYRDDAQNNYLRVSVTSSERGIIYDANLKPLVSNLPTYDLVATPALITKQNEEQIAIIKNISSIIKVSFDDLMNRFNEFDLKSRVKTTFWANIASDNAAILQSEIEKINGLALEKSFVRKYNDAPYFSHILGYTGRINKNELKQYPKYFMTERIGKDGLEAQYEADLHGRVGKKDIEIDATGLNQKVVGQQDAEMGNGLILTIDAGLQKQMQDSLTKWTASLKTGSKMASGVMMNVKTGAILAMVSLPSFDNNVFSKEVSLKDYNKLQYDREKPLLNRAIGGTYYPGSTIKPMVAAAALEEKIVTPNTTIIDYGFISVPNIYNPSIVYTFNDWSSHDVVNMYKAIAQSCDVYFYTVGGGFGDIKGLGISKLAQYYQMFGIDKKTGIDLPGEIFGKVPTPDWKKKIKNEEWFIGDTYNVSIGQGDLMWTPLRSAVALGAIANGGKLMVPHLVSKIIDKDKNVIKYIEPEIQSQLNISSKNLEQVRKGMRQTITNGTASSLNNLSIPIAGKTGTAQVSPGSNTVRSWFSSFAPFDDPEVVMVLLVEDGRDLQPSVVPATREIYDYYYKNIKNK